MGHDHAAHGHGATAGAAHRRRLTVVLGLTLGTRIIGVLAGFYLAVALILYLGLEARSGAGRRELAAKSASIALSFLPMLPVLRSYSIALLR